MTDSYLQRVGTSLNAKWSIQSLIGVGGTGAVYAVQHRNGRRAAAKILHPELSTIPEIVGRFLREGYIANKIDHPGVVAVLDDDQTPDGLVYLVLELLTGASLDSMLERRGSTIGLREALNIIDEVLDVLAAAHEKSIVHRDVKPENIFLVQGGGIKVLDFGIAKLRDVSTGANATLAGSVFGTSGFMPPEQARGRSELIDARTDVWAVGATLYSMLTGQRLHRAETQNESLLLAMTEPVPPMRDILPSLPCQVAQVLDRALAFNREDRWPDARAMQVAVREAMQSVSETLQATPQTCVPVAEGQQAPHPAVTNNQGSFSGTYALLPQVVTGPRVSAVSPPPTISPARRRPAHVVPWALGATLFVLLGMIGLVVQSRSIRSADPHVAAAAFGSSEMPAPMVSSTVSAVMSAELTAPAPTASSPSPAVLASSTRSRPVNPNDRIVTPTKRSAAPASSTVAPTPKSRPADPLGNRR